MVHSCTIARNILLHSLSIFWGCASEKPSIYYLSDYFSSNCILVFTCNRVNKIYWVVSSEMTETLKVKKLIFLHWSLMIVRMMSRIILIAISGSRFPARHKALLWDQQFINLSHFSWPSNKWGMFETRLQTSREKFEFFLL